MFETKEDALSCPRIKFMSILLEGGSKIETPNHFYIREIRHIVIQKFIRAFILNHIRRKTICKMQWMNNNIRQHVTLRMCWWFLFVPAREMGPRELLANFVSFPLVVRSTPTLVCFSFLPIRSWSYGVGWMSIEWVPAEGTPTLKSVKGVFGTRKCTVINDIPTPWNVCYLCYL